MKLNTKTRYGLRTMIELAIQNDNSYSVFQKDIAKRQNLSIKYLDQIIATLKISGLIANTGGRRSGYKLTRNPKNISVYDICNAFDSDFGIIECIKNEGICSKEQSCSAREFWKSLNEYIINYMKSVKLKDLTINRDKMSQFNENNMYYI